MTIKLIWLGLPNSPHKFQICAVFTIRLEPLLNKSLLNTQFDNNIVLSKSLVSVIPDKNQVQGIKMRVAND
jgi:hypothetical protein